VTLRPFIVTVTPETGGIGFLPVRDMVVLPWSNRHTPSFLHMSLPENRKPALRAHALEDAAEYLATQVLGSCFVIGHHALGGRHDRHTQTVGDRGDVLDRRIDAAPGPGDALDGADHRLAVGILQLDLELGDAVLGLVLGV